MKKQKLKLSDLEVDSFITTSKNEEKTVNGGAWGDFVSLIPGLNGACMIYQTAQISGHTGEITETVIRSQQQMDCAGATRLAMGCTDGGTFPCDTGCI